MKMYMKIQKILKIQKTARNKVGYCKSLYQKQDVPIAEKSYRFRKLDARKILSEQTYDEIGS